MQGTAIVPATAYIEMALATAREILGTGSLSVRQIENRKPIVLQDANVQLLQTVLTIESGGLARLAIYSRPKDDHCQSAKAEGWTAHVAATIAEIASSPPADGLSKLTAARERCEREIIGSKFYALMAARGNQWGPCFQGMEQVWVGTNEAVARIQVPRSLENEMLRYQFHPAVSDACGHSLLAAVSPDQTKAARYGAVVGSSVGEIRFHRRPVGSTLWAHAKLQQLVEGESNIVVGDVEVYDEDGTPVAETRDARLWYFDEHAGAAGSHVPPDWYYEVRWRARPRSGERVRSTKAGPWLILADNSGIAEGIAARLKTLKVETILVLPGDHWSLAGERCRIRPEKPEDYKRLFDHAGKPAAVVHLWSIEAKEDSPLDRTFERGPASLLQLLHGLLSAESSPKARIWAVTRDAQAVVGDDRCYSPWSAALWGLGRAISVEHAELWGGLIDLPGDASIETTADQLVAEILEGNSEDKIAFRDGQRYVARLERRRPPSSKTR